MIEYRAIITVVSSHKDYPPINFAVVIPEELAKMLMATPIGTMSISIEFKGNTLDQIKLVDFK